MGRRYAALCEVPSGFTAKRVGTATSAGEARGVSSSGSLPALREVVGLPRSGASSSVDSNRVVVGSRECGSLKQSAPKFGGKPEDFHLRRSTSRCLLSSLGVCLRSSQCSIW